MTEKQSKCKILLHNIKREPAQDQALAGEGDMKKRWICAVQSRSVILATRGNSPFPQQPPFAGSADSDFSKLGTFRRVVIVYVDRRGVLV